MYMIDSDQRRTQIGVIISNHGPI